MKQVLSKSLDSLFGIIIPKDFYAIIKIGLRMKNKKYGKAQQVLIAAVGINILMAFLYIWSVISKELIAQYGWTSKQASLPYTAHTVATMITMVLFGKFVQSKGPRWIGTLGAIMSGGDSSFRV